MREMTFDRPGVVKLLCHVHPEMSAFIMVAETPYHAVTGPDGRFEIRAVPDGVYTLKAWHEDAVPASVQVSVTEGEIAEVRLTLK